MDMSVDRRRLRTGFAGTSTLLMLVAALWGLAGCGGSGSSGFDVSPLVSEDQAVARAIDRQQCVEFELQTFCASGVQPEAGKFEGASVTIQQQPEDPLVCDGRITSKECTASLQFTTEGFNIPNSLLAAVAQSEHGPWRLAPLTVSEDVTGPRLVSINVPGDADAPSPTPVIAAVLVYVGTAPETVPQTADHIADFGVDLVYVSPRLEIVVPR
jgi:hypothetical protein